MSKKSTTFIKFISFFLISTMLLSGCSSSGKPKTSNEKTSENKIPLNFTNEEAINLWSSDNNTPYFDSETTMQAVTITPYISENNVSGGCVIICPGGGYNHVTTEKEGTIPAKEFNENGISAFVLNYRVTPYDYKASISDILSAVRFVRFYAKDFGIDENKISVMGFSAGGHLAAMALENYEDKEFNLSTDDIDKISAKPNNGILCYSVITMTNPYAHKGSRANFLGKENETDEALQKRFSAELNVTSDTSPCFIWHCKSDTSVPYQNSQLFVDKMKALNIDCDYHLYNRGMHGLGMAEGHKEVEEWFGDCVEWLRNYGY